MTEHDVRVTALVANAFGLATVLRLHRLKLLSDADVAEICHDALAALEHLSAGIAADDPAVQEARRLIEGFPDLL
uniref:Uncharacterized protein n=1 Tax=Rhodopseudomonas palustris (strain DX-1) TaxID=652103 RepID=E6VFJ8_RHOPX